MPTLPPLSLVRPGRAPEFTVHPTSAPPYHPLDHDDPLLVALGGRRTQRHTFARTHAPAFDPSHTLTEVYDSRWPLRERAWFLGVDKDGDPRRLDSTSRPLHDFFTHTELHLTARTARHWLRFFCYFVHGEDGPFLIADDPLRLADHAGLPEHHRRIAAVTKHLQPITRVRTRSKAYVGRYVYDTTVHYHTTLFRSRFAVSIDGQIDMISDDVKLENTGLRISRPLH